LSEVKSDQVLYESQVARSLNNIKADSDRIAIES